MKPVPRPTSSSTTSNHMQLSPSGVERSPLNIYVYVWYAGLLLAEFQQVLEAISAHTPDGVPEAISRVAAPELPLQK